YYVFVVADSQYFVPDAYPDNNVGGAAQGVAADVPVLALGVPAAGTVASGQDLYFRVDVPADQDILLTANFAGPAQVELYERYYGVPDRSNFDHTAQSASDPRPQILLPSGEAGAHYVLIHGATGAGTFTLTAQAA